MPTEFSKLGKSGQRWRKLTETRACIANLDAALIAAPVRVCNDWPETNDLSRDYRGRKLNAFTPCARLLRDRICGDLTGRRANAASIGKSAPCEIPPPKHLPPNKTTD
jgi:hypothetical protein